MPQVKRAAKGKRSNKAVSVLGIAGVSWAASTGGSPADIPPASLVSPPAGSVANLLWQDAALRIPFLDEEEISDVSLATFHLFDEDNFGNSQPGIQLAFRGCGGGCGCHGGGGCRGCGGGFRGCGGGFRGCGVGVRGCRGCAVGFRGCGFGGCGCGGCGLGWGWGGGCCLSWGGCALC
jgi:hypothetical protein